MIKIMIMIRTRGTAKELCHLPRKAGRVSAITVVDAPRRSYLDPFRNLNMEMVLPRSAKETSVM
jgi:hypothetical protein